MKPPKAKCPLSLLLKALKCVVINVCMINIYTKTLRFHYNNEMCSLLCWKSNSLIVFLMVINM